MHVHIHHINSAEFDTVITILDLYSDGKCCLAEFPSVIANNIILLLAIKPAAEQTIAEHPSSESTELHILGQQH